MNLTTAEEGGQVGSVPLRGIQTLGDDPFERPLTGVGAVGDGPGSEPPWYVHEKRFQLVPTACLARRFLLQRVAAELMPSERRLRGCFRWVLPDRTAVQLHHHPGREVGSVGGLMRCGSVWLCPICATKVSERRRIELRDGVRTWQGRGGSVALNTYTVRHWQADSLKDTLTGLLGARKRLLSGRWASELTDRHQVVGRVRSLEVTHGENGWHPHVHELTFHRGSVDQAQLLEDLRSRWSHAVQAAGLRDVNSHGVDVRVGDWTVAEYVAKFGRERSWDVEHELTKAVSKHGKWGNRGPIGLLSDYVCCDEKAGNLWRMYARHFKGKRQLVWSDGLRKLLSLGEEKTDEEIVLEQTDPATLMDELDRGEWKQVLGNDARSELLEVLGRGSVAELKEFLNSLGIER